ncbi:UNVERIFIED_CONTAM: hypothetical protein K2H54_000857 [Gekko kuhli]
MGWAGKGRAGPNQARACREPGKASPTEVPQSWPVRGAGQETEESGAPTPGPDNGSKCKGGAGNEWQGGGLNGGCTTKQGGRGEMSFVLSSGMGNAPGKSGRAWVS